jgi:hypothetical protein
MSTSLPLRSGIGGAPSFGEVTDLWPQATRSTTLIDARKGMTTSLQRPLVAFKRRCSAVA